jgi:aspartyl/asparaginyl beta-hydroxylase
VYQKIRQYQGQVPLVELAKRFRSFEIAWAPTGYGTTTDHLVAVRDAFRSDLVDELPGEWTYTMLVMVKPDGFIRYHNDIPSRPNVLRHHLVLQTNAECWNLHGREWQQLDLGGIYTMNETVKHASINFGDSARIHLVVDINGGPK